MQRGYKIENKEKGKYDGKVALSLFGALPRQPD